MNKIQSTLIKIAKACGKKQKPYAKARIISTGEIVDVYGKPAKLWDEGERVFIYSHTSPLVWTARNVSPPPKKEGEAILHVIHSKIRLHKVILKEAIVIQKF